MKLLNGWTVETALDQIEKRNGWKLCATETGFCCYRNPEGAACAIGAFIPDDHKDIANIAQFEGGVISVYDYEDKDYALFYQYPDLVNIMPLTDTDCWNLQQMHDKSDWEKETVREFLIECAERYK